MNQENKTLLRQVCEAASAKGRDGKELWDIISALRGPDIRVEVGIKSATTGVIRHYAGFNRPWYSSGPDKPMYVDVRKKLSDEAFERPELYHFVQHAKEAFNALGLGWDRYNEPV